MSNNYKLIVVGATGYIGKSLYADFIANSTVGYYKRDSFDRKPNPGMLLRAAEKHRLDMGNSIMIGDKDSDMQAASKAGVGLRCHYLTDGHEGVMSSAATHKIHSLREGILLLSESVAT